MKSAKSKLETRAKNFAKHWHGSYVRKYTGALCWHHPSNVASLVKTVTHTPDMVVAAWMYDILKDTACNTAKISSAFGATVTELVLQLTDVSKPTDGDRIWQMAINLEHTARATPEAKTVKLAHVIESAHSLISLDPQFARTYLLEKRWLLDAALKDGDSKLWRMANQLVVKQAR